MSFIHPLLLGGLLLVGVPVLIHLIMQQKPKRLLFPAFRFLQQRFRTNQRRLRLRHLLLLALRMLLIAGICLALARPKVFSDFLGLSRKQSVAVVLLFDTSFSMDYQVAGQNRLDDARQGAQEVLDSLPSDSRVAVLDSAEQDGEWITSVAEARKRINGLKLRPVNQPLTRQIDTAYRLLHEVRDDDEPPPRFLYVFSDRTQACWDASQARGLQQPEGVRAWFVDVGVEEPVDLAILRVKLEREVVPASGQVEIHVMVRATGADFQDSTDTHYEVQCRIDDEKKVQQQPIKVRAGQSQEVIFARSVANLREPEALPLLGPHKVEVKLVKVKRGTDRVEAVDALAFNNVGFATFEVWEDKDSKPSVLIVTDKRPDAYLWDSALKAKGLYNSEVQTTAEAGALTANDLSAKYKAVCLLSVAEPNPALWAALEGYVQKGGSLLLLPGGEELKQEAYHEDPAAQRLLPGQLIQLMPRGEPGALWVEVASEHRLVAPFVEWRQNSNIDFAKPEVRPAASRYWEVRPREDAAVLFAYADERNRPALLERHLGNGHVLLFTTPFDGRRDERNRWWNNYLESSFFLVLANEAVGHLTWPPSFNYLVGQKVTVALPKTRLPLYTVVGPGIDAQDTVLPHSGDQNTLQVSQAATPGNFSLFARSTRPFAGFSLNARPEESQLTRSDAESIKTLLGEEALLPAGSSTSLADTVQSTGIQAIELFPWLMIAVLLVLAVENLLANRFYKRPPPEQETPDLAAGLARRESDRPASLAAK